MANDAWYTEGQMLVQQQLLNLVGNAQIKLIIVQSSYSFSQQDLTVSGLGGAELSVAGYTRKTANGVDFTISRSKDTAATPDTVRYIFDQNVTWAALAAGETIGSFVLIDDTGNDVTSPLIAHFGQVPTPTNGGDITATVELTLGNLLVENPVAP